MSSWRLWLLWFVLLLWDAPPTVTAISLYNEPKGAERSVRCSSGKNQNVTRRIFCKNDCEEGDILVQTSGSRQTNGRFRIKHEMKGSPPKDFIYVTISNLTLSDSGRYRCKWDRPVRSSSVEFRIEVTDGVDAESKREIFLAAGEDFSHTFHFFNSGKKKTFCRNNCSGDDILFQMMENEARSVRYRIQYKKHADDLSEVTVTIRNVSSSDSGLYKCYLDQSSYQIRIKVSPGGAPNPQNLNPEPTQNLTMILVLIPVCVVVLVTVITLTICSRRKRSDQGPGAGGTEAAEREYENIYPQPPSENVYENLRLEEVEPTYNEINKI